MYCVELREQHCTSSNSSACTRGVGIQEEGKPPPLGAKAQHSVVDCHYLTLAVSRVWLKPLALASQAPHVRPTKVSVILLVLAAGQPLQVVNRYRIFL